MTRGRPRHVHPPPAPLRSFNKRLLRLSRLARRWYVKHGAFAQRALALVVSLALLLLLVLRGSFFGSAREQPVHVVYPALTRFRPELNHTRRLEDEHALAAKLCARHILSPQVEELRTCNQIQPVSGGKVVALVELRNVRNTLSPFLSSLASVTHSVVALDDHSTDGTRNELLRSPHVELILNRTGEWRRDELADRQMLLEAARRIGATHFVLLDYDEFISHNCLPFIQDEILKLKPGESMFIPWVEAWKSPFAQRVLKDDPQMNFLTRRQTVIFADDRYFSYTAENALSRTLSNNATLHVLRCPRSLCPPPGPYKGPADRYEFPPSVKVLPQCRILEMRFLNINNVLIKSAWYEALGRVLGAEDGVTSGKMISRMFATSDDSSVKEERVFLAPVDQDWLAPDATTLYDPFHFIETWRASELLQWIKSHGADRFNKLPIMNSIHFGELRLAMGRAMLEDTQLGFVPRRKSGVLVFAVENPLFAAMSRLLGAVGFEELRQKFAKSADEKVFDPSVASYNQVRQYERLKVDMERLKQSVLRSGDDAQYVYVSFADVSEDYQLMLLEYAAAELWSVHVLVVFADWYASRGDSRLYISSRNMAHEPGSHLHVIDMPMQAFGSFSALRWLCERLPHRAKTATSKVSDSELVGMAEQNHKEFLSVQQHSGAPALLPVARLIFSLNVGRSGSRYLADILGTVDNPIFATHEARCPDGGCSGGGAMRMQDVPLKQSYKERQHIKIPMILDAIASVYNTTEVGTSRTQSVHCSVLDRERWGEMDGVTDLEYFRPVFEVSSQGGCALHVIKDVVYAETNPNFKSWMYDVVLEHFPGRGYDVTVVVVRKYLAAVVRSLYKTGYFSSRDGYKWMETAAGVNSKLRLKELEDDSQLDTFGKLISGGTAGGGRAAGAEHGGEGGAAVQRGGRAAAGGRAGADELGKHDGGGGSGAGQVPGAAEAATGGGGGGAGGVRAADCALRAAAVARRARGGARAAAQVGARARLPVPRARRFPRCVARPYAIPCW
ncbi:hypothetical protein FGB62_48g122 [Gracilaria domingensis]|nr:hypothetical protein FGB62_48g122 [Gracilaria domingensis]